MRRPHRSVVLALLALVLAACTANPTPNPKVSSARRAATESGGAGCLDTLRATDSVVTIVKMSVAPQDPKTKLPPDFESLFAEAFRPSFRAPSRLPLSVVSGTEPCDSLGSRCAGGVLNIGAVAYVTAHRDGKLSDAVVVDVALTRNLANTVRSALESTSRNQAVPWMGHADSIPLVVTFSAEESPDSVPASRRVFRAQVPRYDMPFSYAAMPLAGVDAHYPAKAQLAGVEDSVTLAFTVEADGTIAPESIELVSARYGDFVTSVVDALGNTRYHPAHLGDCAVATRMKQRFVFRAPQ
ncbi:MAG: energy transducer TonB [Gemmatimonadota bacterium]|nr:energy transducer TonB [Gemmatimonadota bacterium]